MKALLLYGKYSEGMVALVDDDVYESVIRWYWRVNEAGYVARCTKIRGRDQLIKLHRQIMSPVPGRKVDHRSSDKLDCQRANLRLCTSAWNNFNGGPKSPGLKGASLFKPTNRWKAHIQFQGNRIDLGYYADEEEAAHIYDQVVMQLFGSFAKTNIVYN